MSSTGTQGCYAWENKLNLDCMSLGLLLWTRFQHFWATDHQHIADASHRTSHWELRLRNI